MRTVYDELFRGAAGRYAVCLHPAVEEARAKSFVVEFEFKMFRGVIILV